MAADFTILSASVSDRGLSEKRPQNEDSYLELPAKGIFAVADGVGGAQAGEVASQMAMEILGEAFNNMPDGHDAEETMRQALVQANAAIHQMSTELPQLAQMATTVVALHLDGNIATIGHAGDSRLYRLDASGSLHRETEDHSMVADEVRAGRMTEEQAENHPGKNIINRALGAESSVELELKTKIISENCIYLLCSDGVTRHIPDSELATILTSGEPQEVCSVIRSMCYQRGAEDNLTAVIVRYESEKADAATMENEEFIDTLPPSAVVEHENDDEATVASARLSAEPDDDDVLELDTAEIKLPHTGESEDIFGFHDSEPAQKPVATVSAEPENVAAQSEIVEPSVTDTVPLAVSSPVVETPTVRSPMASYDSAAGSSDSGTKTLAAAVGSLILGALIGLGIYHFMLVPPPVNGPQIGEMRAQNIPLTAFEENRRNVDREPSVYIQKATAPEDAEDHYLLGRAYLLTGDFPKARSSFQAARERMNEADPANAQVMKDDIALALAVTNDTTIQNILKKELDAVRISATPPTNANR